MRVEGKLIQWDDAKGYGFIAPDAGGAKLFVHLKAFGLRPRRPFVGERLSYVAGVDGHGKARAQQVQSLEPKPAPAPPSGASARARRRAAQQARPSRTSQPSPQAGAGAGGAMDSRSLWLIPAFALLVLVCQLAWGLPHMLWGGYLAMSMATFIVYAGDKRAARLQQWRVSESTLHGLALACGWPGALLAQQMLRHKSSKPAFRRRFWMTVILNLLLFVLLFTPLGTRLFARYFPV